MSELKLIGVPRDGSTPFLMALCDSVERAREIYSQTHRHYVQPLAGWEVHDRNGQVIKRNVPLLAD